VLDLFTFALVRAHNLVFALLFPTSTMALNPPPLKLYDCASFALDNINEFAKGQGYAVLQVGRMVVEVKILCRWPAKYWGLTLLARLC
jgi:hypothetical protein